MQKFEIGLFVRQDQPVEINTIDLVDLMKQAGADGFKVSETKFGTRIFLCKGDVILPVKAIGIGNKANRPTADLLKEPVTAIRQLMDNNELYWGKGDNGYWLRFSRKGTFVPGTVVSFKDIMAATGIKKEELAGG